MTRILVCGSITLSLLLFGLHQKSQRLILAAQLEKERVEWEKARSEAREQAVHALQAMQRVYEKRLREQARARADINQKHDEAIIQIEEGRKNGPQDYRSWAGQSLPDVVIERLRKLPEERTAAGHHGLPHTTP